MGKLIKIAWRNLWRNKRRSFITIASIIFAVFFALVMRSMQEGSYGNMIKNVVKSYSGYLQIHEKDYWEKKSIDNTFAFTDSLLATINSIPGVKGYIPRLEGFALASAGKRTKGILIVGTNPAKEDEMTTISKKIIKGNYLTPNDSGVLLAEKLAEYLQLDVGDTVVFLGQGYHGVGAADQFRITGIVRLPSPKLNNSMVYMPLSLAQSFYSAEDQLTSCVIDVSKDNVQTVQQSIANKIRSSDLSVMNWREIQPELVQQIESDRSGGIVMLAILYMIIGFGILGTVIMMVAERLHELGILIAIGMHKRKIITTLFYETFFLGLTGIIVGSIIASPVIWYMVTHPIRLTGTAAEAMVKFGIEPIMPSILDWHIFVNQAIIIFSMSLLAFLYPIFVITKMKVINALRS
ncbi:MAG: ABC transporter permease [Bacteroidales bacterium]|nr:ABC transporter permease [Bacteroidales bacterium]